MSTLRPETALRSILLDDAEIVNRVGTRLTRSAALQSSQYPFGIFARTKTDPHYTMGGGSDLREVDVQFAWYDEDFDALDALIQRVEAVLSDFEGDVIVEDKQVHIDTVYLTDERDGDLITADGTGVPLYCIEQVFRVAYNLNMEI